MFEDEWSPLPDEYYEYDDEVVVHCDWCGARMVVDIHEAASNEPLYCSTDCELEADFEYYDDGDFHYDEDMEDYL